MNSDIKVVKSDGSKVDLNLDKIHKWLRNPVEVLQEYPKVSLK